MIVKRRLRWLSMVVWLGSMIASVIALAAFATGRM